MQKQIGHNNPPKEKLSDKFEPLPKEITDLIDARGRIELKNSIIKKLKRNEVRSNNDIKFYDCVYYDTERVGLQLKVNADKATKSFYFQMWNKDKKRPVRYFLGRFPEMKVDNARHLVKAIKEGAALGKSPKDIIEEQKSVPTLKEVIKQWKEKRLTKEGRSEKTITDIKERFRNYIYLKATKPDLQSFLRRNYKILDIASKQINKITKEDIWDYHRTIGERSKSLANRILDDLKVIVSWSMTFEKWGVRENFVKLEKSKLFTIVPRIENINTQPFTKEQTKEILQRIRDKLYTAKGKRSRNYSSLLGIYVSLYVGRRYVSELFSVPWSKLEGNTIFLKRTKNDKQGTFYKLNSQSMWAIIKLRAYCRFKFKETRQIRFKKYIFPSPKPKGKGHLGRVNKTWFGILNELNLPKLPMYMCRHTWASNAFAAGKTIKEVKDEGGWKTYKMVEKYAKRNEKMREETSQEIADYIDS